MDWIRRNWPDLLIGLALLAVIAAIVATLISGGSFFSLGGGGGPTTPTSPPAQTTTTPPAGETTTPSTTPQGVVPTLPDGSTPAASGEVTGAETQDPAAGSTDDPAAAGSGDQPAPDGSGVATTGESPAAEATPTESGTTEVTALPPGSESATGVATPPTTPEPVTVAPVTPTTPSGESSYRVSVGAFGNSENAQRLAGDFQSAGYPVLLGSQGSLTIVLVGPYDTEADARRVADEIRDGSFGVPDPTVYLYEPSTGDDASTAGAPPAAPATAEPVATTATAPAAVPAAASSGRYLQVGAYANRESSLPQRARLEGLGFTVTEVEEGSFVKLLVGPYQGADLNAAQSRLAAEDIENFARSL